MEMEGEEKGSWGKRRIGEERYGRKEGRKREVDRGETEEGRGKGNWSEWEEGEEVKRLGKKEGRQGVRRRIEGGMKEEGIRRKGGGKRIG